MPPRSSSGRRWVALLRGVNVGKAHRIAMSVVREAFAEAGCADVSTYIQSGNVVMRHAAADPKRLARRIEIELARAAGFPIPVVLRTSDELAQVVARSPFPVADPGELHVIFCDESPPEGLLAQLDHARFAPEAVTLVGRELHLHVPGGLGRSALAVALAKLKLPLSTQRNWRTVEKLVALANAPD